MRGAAMLLVFQPDIGLARSPLTCFRLVETMVSANGAWFATAAWWFAGAGLVVFAVVSIMLIIVDLRRRRLPDSIVLPGLALISVLLIASASCLGDWTQVGRIISAALTLFVGYLVAATVVPAGIGGGDVKLAPLLGVVLGWASWEAVLIGVFVSAVLGGLWAISLIVCRRRSPGTTVPYGPCMLAGAWLGIIAEGAALAG